MGVGIRQTISLIHRTLTPVPQVLGACIPSGTEVYRSTITKATRVYDSSEFKSSNNTSHTIEHHIHFIAKVCLHSADQRLSQQPIPPAFSRKMLEFHLAPASSRACHSGLHGWGSAKLSHARDAQPSNIPVCCQDVYSKSLAFDYFSFPESPSYPVSSYSYLRFHVHFCILIKTSPCQTRDSIDDLLNDSSWVETILAILQNSKSY